LFSLLLIVNFFLFYARVFILLICFILFIHSTNISPSVFGTPQQTVVH